MDPLSRIFEINYPMLVDNLFNLRSFSFAGVSNRLSNAKSIKIPKLVRFVKIVSTTHCKGSTFVPLSPIVYFGAPPTLSIELYGAMLAEINFDNLLNNKYQFVSKIEINDDGTILHFDGSDDVNYYYHITNGGDDNLIEIQGSY